MLDSMEFKNEEQDPDSPEVLERRKKIAAELTKLFPIKFSSGERRKKAAAKRGTRRRQDEDDGEPVIIDDDQFHILAIRCADLKIRKEESDQWAESKVNAILNGEHRPHKPVTQDVTDPLEAARYLFELSEHLARLDNKSPVYEELRKTLKECYTRIIQFYAPPRPDPVLEISGLLSYFGLSKYEARQVAGTICARLFGDGASFARGEENVVSKLASVREKKQQEERQSTPTKRRVMIRVPRDA